jgi:uncharacterized iron-regulated membrane protein
MRYWIGRIHLWLGLASGLVVFIVSLTGCLFSFQKEIAGVWYRDRFFVTPAPGNRPLGVLLQTAGDTLRAPVDYITTYRDPACAWEFMTYKTNDTALTYFGNVERFRSVFIDPHTGRVTGFRDYKHDFFNIVKYVHWSLLLRNGIGQPIVGWSTMAFVVLSITGLVLWWPRRSARTGRRWTKAARKQGFTIRWGARFKRLNYDLHNVLGFYTLLVALILGLTGMVFAFAWFSKGVGAIGGKTAAADTTQLPWPLAAPGSFDASRRLDDAFTAIRARYPDARRIGLSPPAGNTLYCSAYDGRETYYDRTDFVLNLGTGRLATTRFAQRGTGDRLVNMNYDIHVGAIGGLPGKILAFLVSLVCASLPVTGFLYWLWRAKHHSSTTSQKASLGSPSTSKSKG